MQTKTYFASSVPAALEVARKELGGDALLVNSKPSSAAARPFGRLEVTFAYDAPAVAAPRTRVEPERMSFPEGSTAVMPGTLSSVELRLCAAGLETDTAREIASAAAKRQGDRAAAVALELRSRIPEAQFPEWKAGETRTLAFIGPPGRGKTTSLIKIAVRFGIAQRLPVRIYSAGAHRVGGQDQMARYASILGVPFQACESLDSLHLALNGDPWKGLILIDTPGLSAGDRAEITEFAGFFSQHTEIQKHLVLRSDARSADMALMVNRFKTFAPSRLLFTGMDESTGSGTMAETIIRTGLPSIFAGTGQKIPEDLELLNVSRLARSLMGEIALAAAA